MYLAAYIYAFEMLILKTMFHFLISKPIMNFTSIN